MKATGETVFKYCTHVTIIISNYFPTVHFYKLLSLFVTCRQLLFYAKNETSMMITDYSNSYEYTDTIYKYLLIICSKVVDIYKNFI